MSDTLQYLMGDPGEGLRAWPPGDTAARIEFICEAGETLVLLFEAAHTIIVIAADDPLHSDWRGLGRVCGGFPRSHHWRFQAPSMRAT